PDCSRGIPQRPREFRRNPAHTRCRVMGTEDQKSVLCFLALAFGISSIFYGRSFAGAPLSSVTPFLMWTPGVCAIVTKLVFNRSLVAGVGCRFMRHASARRRPDVFYYRSEAGDWRQLILVESLAVACTSVDS